MGSKVVTCAVAVHTASVGVEIVVDRHAGDDRPIGVQGVFHVVDGDLCRAGSVPTRDPLSPVLPVQAGVGADVVGGRVLEATLHGDTHVPKEVGSDRDGTTGAGAHAAAGDQGLFGQVDRQAPGADHRLGFKAGHRGKGPAAAAGALVFDRGHVGGTLDVSPVERTVEAHDLGNGRRHIIVRQGCRHKLLEFIPTEPSLLLFLREPGNGGPVGVPTGPFGLDHMPDVFDLFVGFGENVRGAEHAERQEKHQRQAH